MRVAIAAAALLAAAAAAPARAEPSNGRLVLVGIGLAPVDFVAGDSLHEASHALMAKLVGADLDEFHPWPGVDPHIHSFRFGWTYVHGLATRDDKLLFYLAPKFTNLALFGGFAALAFTGAWPHNRYAQLGLTVAATGLWFDFSQDVVLTSGKHDMSKVFDLWCMHGGNRVAARIVYGTISAGLGLVVAKGYVRTFSRTRGTDPVPLVAPLFTAAF